MKSPTYSICHIFISQKSVDKSGCDKSEDGLYSFTLVDDKELDMSLLLDEKRNISVEQPEKLSCPHFRVIVPERYYKRNFSTFFGLTVNF